MKYVFSNGAKLEVREIGDVLFEMYMKSKELGDPPLPIVAKEIMSDEDARKLVKNLKETGYYNSVDPNKQPKRDF